MQAGDPRGPGEHLIKDTQLGQHRHSGRLEKKPGPDGLAGIRPLENDDVVPLALQ